MYYKTLLSIISILLLHSFIHCIYGQSEEFSNAQDNLWVDQTSLYLPITEEWTNRVEAADINGDNRVDLLFANGGDYSAPGQLEYSRIFINQGPNQRFKEVTKDIFGDQKFISRVIKVRDVNGDDVPDIIVGTTYQSQSQLYLGTGSGNFQNVTASHFPILMASIGDLELGDVDDDGDLDIVLTDWGPGNNMDNIGGRTLLWLNDGSGKFTDVTSSQMPDLLIQFSWDLEFIDLDNDFDLDIAISCKRCPTGRIFMNDGNGNFEDKRMLPAYTNNYDFEAMDVNLDGYLDLVTVNDGEIVNGDSYSRREHLFINEEGKRFRDKTSELWPDSANIGEDDNNIVFLDFDSDGDPDFLLSSLTGEDRLLVNNGFGRFDLIQPVLKGKPTPLTLSMVLADVDDDHRLDIIMGQGEGKDGIEERIFIGNGIKPDSAPPIISHHQIVYDDSGLVIGVKARIHDHKTPNMPQDWESVFIVDDNTEEQIPIIWYGENLWKATISPPKNSSSLRICAIDKATNGGCIEIK